MKILVVAPHPDDESLGCGGTLLRMRREHPATQLHWMLVTGMRIDFGYSEARIDARRREISAVAEQLGVARLHELQLPPARLDNMPLADLVQAIGNVISHEAPNVIYVPYRYDAHTDHRYVFDAVAACTKTFRFPSVKRVLAYETISETEFSIDPGAPSFRPNVWVDISADLDGKLKLIRNYSTELADFPFPRSVGAVEALARFRGSTIGVPAAEAFMLLKEVG